jgi:hypothetical protein
MARAPKPCRMSTVLGGPDRSWYHDPQCRTAARTVTRRSVRLFPFRDHRPQGEPAHPIPIGAARRPRFRATRFLRRPPPPGSSSHRRRSGRLKNLIIVRPIYCCNQVEVSWLEQSRNVGGCACLGLRSRRRSSPRHAAGPGEGRGDGSSVVRQPGHATPTLPSVARLAAARPSDRQSSSVRGTPVPSSGSRSSRCWSSPAGVAEAPAGS